MSTKRKEASSIEEMIMQISELASELSNRFEGLLVVDWSQVDDIDRIYNEMQWVEYNLRKIRLAKRIVWRRLLSKMNKNLNTSEKSGS